MKNFYMETISENFQLRLEIHFEHLKNRPGKA
jgi:hypothetical protein